MESIASNGPKSNHEDKSDERGDEGQQNKDGIEGRRIDADFGEQSGNKDNCCDKR